MVKILWIISLIVIAHASKEKLQDLDQLLDDPNIWQYIEKRVEQEKKDDIPIENNHDDSVGDVDPPKQKIELQNRHQNFRQPDRASENERHYPNYRNQHNFHETNPYGLKTLSDSSGNACSYNLNSSVIIKSKSSLDNGAAYLKNAFNLSAKECAKKCCYTQNCNLAVYEEKEEHSCYLFDCGTPSKCVFAHHGNYSVMSFQINDFMPSAHQQYHENELENLGKVKPPTPSPPPPTTHTPTPYPQRAKVPLYGDCDIDWDEQCVDRNAECRDEQCKCKKGYHAIYAICREVCNEDEFQCKNKGQDFDVPDCIDSKHRCDGVPQCADGSDEEKCPKKPEDKQSSDKDEIHEDKVNTPAPPKPVVEQPEDKQPNVPDESDKDIPLETDVKDEDKDQESKADSKEKEPVDQKPVDKPETATKSTTTMSGTPKEPTGTEKKVGLEGPKKVVIKSPTDNNQGPIVALALGLGICLMLLIFVGCRLRTVKRKIRRGKSLHSNEADYLINGMYL
ncbi:Hypothetical predicted protein [Mytilus galloprovincialis]|nr:Hypothetical predicted protein [Mytilus galloprovincialis]